MDCDPRRRSVAVIAVVVELFARHREERRAIVWAATDLTTVTPAPRRRPLGKAELGLLGG